MSTFLNDVAAFHQLMGTQKFWALPEKHHDAALAGLAFGYLRDTGDQERAAVALDAAVQEYERRRLYMVPCT